MIKTARAVELQKYKRAIGGAQGRDPVVTGRPARGRSVSPAKALEPVPAPPAICTPTAPSPLRAELRSSDKMVPPPPWRDPGHPRKHMLQAAMSD